MTRISNCELIKQCTSADLRQIFDLNMQSKIIFKHISLLNWLTGKLVVEYSIIVWIQSFKFFLTIFKGFSITLLRHPVPIKKILESGNFLEVGVKAIWAAVFMNINFNCENVIYFKNDKKDKIVIVYKHLLVIFLPQTDAWGQNSTPPPPLPKYRTRDFNYFF